MTQYDYAVTYKPEGVATDITDFVERIDAIEIGSGEVRSCMLRLNATDGAFITNPDFTGTNKTPVLDQFDKIRLQITDRDSNVYDVTYEVSNLKPIQNSSVGIIVEVEMLGQEHWLQKIMFAKPFFQDSGFDVAKIIIEAYNKTPDSKGSAQATIINHQDTFANGEFNELPLFTANPYTFIVSEQSCYDALITTNDRMGSSVTSGGAGNFFEMGFEDDLTDINFATIKFRGFISGFPPDQTTIPIIEDSVAVNPGEEEGGIESQQGTVLGTWGGDGVGMLPRQNADFRGAIEIWNFYPEHTTALSPPRAGVIWPEDSIVLDLASPERNQDDFFHYKANKDTTLTPPTPPDTSNADWDLHTFVNFLSIEVQTAGQYSRWTDGLANEWIQNGANPDGDQEDDPPVFGGSLSVWDHNQVIVDGTFSRTWVDARATSPAAIPTRLLYPTGTGIQRGLRILVDGVGTGDFTGFDNQVIIFDGTFFRTFKLPVVNQLVAVDNEALIFQFTSGAPDSWVNISASLTQANDCYHPVFKITNEQGFNDKDNGVGGNFGEFSAIQYEFRYRRGDVGGGLINSPQYYRMGAWINFRFPFPFREVGLLGVVKGSLFGKATGDFEPALLDAGNMHLASDGKFGFNNLSAEDLGPIDALQFKTKFEWRYGFDGSGNLVRAGNFACRAVILDSRDDVAMQDFVINFNGDWSQTINLPLTGFSIYRGRRPLTFLNAVDDVLFLQELEVLNVFEWKDIQKIALVWLGPYDDEGRYAAKSEISFLFPSIEDVIAAIVNPFAGIIQAFNVKWSVDAWQFTKPGLSLSPPDPTRAIMPRFLDNSQIDNKFSLDQSNLANLEITQFRHRQYEVTTEGFIGDRDTGLRFGDTFILKNAELVNLSDSGTNTIELVVKQIRYEITKSPHGPGGFLRYLTGVKRFT